MSSPVLATGVTGGRDMALDLLGLMVPMCWGWMMDVVGRMLWLQSAGPMLESLGSISLKKHRGVGMENLRTRVARSAQSHTAAPK